MTLNATLPHAIPTASADAAAMRASVEDPVAFEQVFNAYVDEIFRYAAVRVGAQAGQDVVADTFATAFARRADWREELGGVRPWLYGIAAVHLARLREREQRWLERCAASAGQREPVRDLAQFATDTAAARMLRPRIAAALAQLPTSERDVVLLHAVAELSHEQVARVLGIRRNAAKTRMSRAARRLRALLHDLDPSSPEEHS
ncbi:MAG: RNA polymerase sigma factor [Gaiellales bacterium]